MQSLYDFFKERNYLIKYETVNLRLTVTSITKYDQNFRDPKLPRSSYRRSINPMSCSMVCRLLEDCMASNIVSFQNFNLFVKFQIYIENYEKDVENFIMFSNHPKMLKILGKDIMGIIKKYFEL